MPSIITLRIGANNTLLSDLAGALQYATAQKFPATVRAFRASAALLQSVWKSYANGQVATGRGVKIKNSSGAYAGSIQRRSDGPFSWWIYSNSPYASTIEDGAPAFDMKTTHPWGEKSRVSKDGVPYLIVPKRWGAPGSLRNPLPGNVYAALRMLIGNEEFTMSRIKHSASSLTRFERNAMNNPIPRATYKWGSRLTGMADLNFPELEGLTVFAERGTTRSAGYTTFRVISAAPPLRGKKRDPKFSKAMRGWERSWTVPARQGMKIMQSVVEDTEKDVMQIMRDGLRKDLGI